MHCDPNRAAASQLLGLVNRRGIDTHLVGTRIEHGANVLYASGCHHPRSADKHLAGNLLDGVNSRIALFVAGCDIEKRDLVGALLVIAPRFPRVTGVANAHKVDAFTTRP